MILAAITLAAQFASPALAVDAAAGAQLFRDLKCLGCHQQLIPKPAGRSLESVVAALWNHPSQAWQSDKEVPITDAQNLLLFLLVSGSIEPPGVAIRGARVFHEKRCDGCHAESKSAPSVEKWAPLQTPAILLARIWRHAPLMKAAMDQRTESWPSLNLEETRDLLAFAASRGKPVPPALQTGDPSAGRALFAQPACRTCHPSAQPVAHFRRGHVLTELVAILWNHSPLMTSLPPALSEPELTHLLGYLWEQRYFEREGNSSKGKIIFEAKRCSSCHESPPRKQGMNASSMFSSLWKHSKQASSAPLWPRLSSSEIADLITFLRLRP